MNRRDFILKTGAATGSGLIPVRFYEKCLTWLDRHGEPLIVPPPEPKLEIHALLQHGGDFQLHLGGPDIELPELTWRALFEDYLGIDLNKTTRAEIQEEHGFVFGRLDEECPWETVLNYWVAHGSSMARAFEYLQNLDLGPGFVRDGKVVGSVRFVDGWHPGSDYLAAHAEDAVSLSCLQERLNQLGQNAVIVLEENSFG